MPTFTQNVTLQAGESKAVSFTFNPNTPKVYVVQVNELSGQFTAIEVPYAEIVVSDLQITPPDPYVGDDVVITVVATNIGNAPGSKDIVCTIN